MPVFTSETGVKKCAHEACNCIVTGGDKYCNDYCKTHSEHAESGTCGCGHAKCAENDHHVHTNAPTNA